MKFVSFLFILFATLVTVSTSSPLKHPLKDLVGKTASKLLLSILGKGTYYDVAAGLGSCGELRSNDELVVAVNIGQMKNGANPNKNPHCNKKIKVVGVLGVAVVATIVDTCPGCSTGCLDMSSALFKKVCGDLALGVCNISWDFI